MQVLSVAVYNHYKRIHHESQHKWSVPMFHILYIFIFFESIYYMKKNHIEAFMFA